MSTDAVPRLSWPLRQAGGCDPMRFRTNRGRVITEQRDTWAAAPGDGGTEGIGPPQTFQRLTLCLWEIIDFKWSSSPQSSRRGAALGETGRWYGMRQSTVWAS